MRIVIFLAGMTIGSMIGIFTMAICSCGKDEFSDSYEGEYDESKSKTTKRHDK